MIFNICGIKIEITFLFIALISFMVSLNAPSNVLITVLSSLLHEIGHLIMMIVVDNKPQRVRFEITGINIIRNEDTNISVKNEIFISLGGPIANAVILTFCCVVMCFHNSNLIMTLACINLILMLFNLLPIKKLDGGTAFYYLLSQKLEIFVCNKILKITSLVFIALIYIWGIYIFIVSRYNISLIIIAIFLTLSFFSDNEY